ncbi:hypothetical protein ACWDOR_23805 [Streptosporangium canum]
MQRLTKTLETTRFVDHNMGMSIALPDIDTYGHPALADAYHQLVDTTHQARQASTTLNQLTAEARQTGSHDAAQMADAKQAIPDTQQAQRDAWQALHALLAEHGQELQNHHAAQRAAAADRIRTAAAELRQAAADYIAHTALEQAAAGRLISRPDHIPGLFALDCAFWGDGLNSPAGLETALQQIK